jgi:hypothetical protein
VSTRVADSSYRVDPGAVADAILRGGRGELLRPRRGDGDPVATGRAGRRPESPE